MTLMQGIKKTMSKKKPLVSILINNYNKENFCVKAVESAVRQDYKNREIIFYDDNSSDFSIERIKKLKKKLKIKKLKIIENKNRKSIFSYNQIEGIKKSLTKSNGKIICLLDSDDFFKKNKIKDVVKYFEMNRSCQILFDRPIYYYRHDFKKRDNKDYKMRNNKWPSFPPTSCISFKKKNINKCIKNICIKKYEDLWFDFRISSYFAIKRKKFDLIDCHLTYYRQNFFNYDKKFVKFLNIAWWKRRNQAFDFLKYLDKKEYKKNVFTFDFILTKLINKLVFFS